MPRYIDADELPKVKFHALPYTHIVPSDLMGLQTEAYERGWNDAIDAIVENTETADVVEAKDIEAECELAYKHGWSDCFAEHRWIPVTERLPEKHSSAIVTDFCHITLAYTNNLDEWMDYDGNRLKNVTAWMPLPEPYKEEKANGKD